MFPEQLCAEGSGWECRGFTATGFPHAHHIGFSASHPSPLIIFFPNFQYPLTLSAGTHARYRFLAPFLNTVSTTFTPGKAFAFNAQLLSDRLNVQPVNQVFLLLQLVQYVCHHSFLCMLPGHATAHPFLVFQGTNYSGLCCCGRFPGPVYCVTTCPVVGSTVSPTLKSCSCFSMSGVLPGMAAGVDEAEG